MLSSSTGLPVDRGWVRSWALSSSEGLRAERAKLCMIWLSSSDREPVVSAETGLRGWPAQRSATWAWRQVPKKNSFVDCFSVQDIRWIG